MTSQTRTPTSHCRILTNLNPGHATNLDRLVDLALGGLAKGRLPDTLQFAHTLRGVRTLQGSILRPEGNNLRYAAIVALGLGRTSERQQDSVLDGATAEDLVSSVVSRAQEQSEPGALALAAWASAEVAGKFEKALFDRWVEILRSGVSLATVDTAWIITAAIAARELGDTSPIVDLALPKLMAAQGHNGLFPHTLPASAAGRWRGHVGCFADQVYPIQALSRIHSAHGSAETLRAADACAQRICDLQGTAGQWWWHYDSRDGSIVEGFPVYSVHQHAMAPMALMELQEAGGADHRAEIALGLRWLDSHPEVMEDLVSVPHQQIWRKVGRHEPRKAARSIAAVLTSIRPGLRLPGVDRFLPTSKVDYECRPYELGWLLYAWSTEGIDVSAGSRRANDD